MPVEPCPYEKESQRPWRPTFQAPVAPARLSAVTLLRRSAAAPRLAPATEREANPPQLHDTHARTTRTHARERLQLNQYHFLVNGFNFKHPMVFSCACKSIGIFSDTNVKMVGPEKGMFSGPTILTLVPEKVTGVKYHWKNKCFARAAANHRMLGKSLFTKK